MPIETMTETRSLFPQLETFGELLSGGSGAQRHMPGTMILGLARGISNFCAIVAGFHIFSEN
jgi:hypothetical protein